MTMAATTANVSAALPGSFIGALKVQLRVLVALALRDIVMELGQSRAAVFWMVFRPMLLIVILYITFSIAHRLAPMDMPLLVYLVTGWLGWFMFMRVFKESRINTGLLMFPHVTPLDLMLSNLITEWLIYTHVFVFFALIATMFEGAFPANGLQVLMAFWSVALLAFLGGLSFFSIARIFPAMNNLIVLVRRLGHLVAGVSVTAADTPYSVLSWMKYNPLFHCFELMRTAWWPAYISPIADAGFLAKCIFFMAAIGLILERATRRYI